MEAVQINLVGFNEAEIAGLRQRLEAVAAVREEGIVSGLHAFAIHEVLEAVLVNTTLIAEIATGIGGTVATVNTIISTVKSGVQA